MSSVKVNNFVSRGATAAPNQDTEFDQASPFTVDQLKDFKEHAKINEIKAFQQILSHIPVRDITEQEKEIIRDEMQTQNSMILMIFRFYLQSSEYQFFIRRLKNVAMTKISLKQLKTNENILNERNFGRSPGDDEYINRPDFGRQVSNQDSNGLTSQSTKSYSMFTTPQKGHSTKAILTSNLNSSDLDRAYQNRPSSGLSSAVKQVNLQNNKLAANHLSNNNVRQALMQKDSILNQKDDFRLRTQKPMRGQSPRKHKHPQATSFGAALAQIADLGIDLSHMRDYMQENNMTRNGPSANFTEITEASGGKTPPPIIQSDSETGTVAELTPTRNNSQRNSARIQENKVLFQEKSPDQRYSDIIKQLDVSYAMNILRHQSSKKNNMIDQDDLVLCVQIVSRQRYSNPQLQKECKQIIDMIIQSNQDIANRQSANHQQVYFEEIIGPIYTMNFVANTQFNLEQSIKKMFECFRLQFGMKTFAFDVIKRFIKSSVLFILNQKIGFDRNQIVGQFIKYSQEFLNTSNVQIEGGINSQELQKWIGLEFSTFSNPGSNQGSPSNYINNQVSDYRQNNLTPQLNQRGNSYHQPNLMLQNYNQMNPSYYLNSRQTISSNVSYNGPQLNQSRSPQKELSVSQTYELTSGSSKPSSQGQNSESLIDYLERQKQQQNRYQPGLNTIDQSLFGRPNPQTNFGYMPQSNVLLRLQNENNHHNQPQKQDQKAQRTYTSGFSGGLMENLNSQQSNYSAGSQQKSRLSDGLLNYSQATNDIIRLRPQEVEMGNRRGQNLSMGRNNVSEKFGQLNINESQGSRRY